VADGEGFEPSVPCGTHAFQACPIDRSGTHPKRAYEFGIDCSVLQPLCNAGNAGYMAEQVFRPRAKALPSPDLRGAALELFGL
jgi:hypothetical protein